MNLIVLFGATFVAALLVALGIFLFLWCFVRVMRSAGVAQRHFDREVRG